MTLFEFAKENNPELLEQWHPTLNSDLTPETVSFGSSKKIWWQCEQGHEWQAKVNNRTASRSGCPFCKKRKVFSGLNNLQTEYPKVAAEWHPTLNGDLTPETVSSHNGRRVWWRCEAGHEWQAIVANRTRGTGCPVCAKSKPRQKAVDLMTAHPEIAAEWHPTLNGDLTPETVLSGSGKRVWWQCKLGHEWQTTVKTRTANGSGCPFCKGRKTFSGFNDLKTKYPRIAAEWHPTRNGDLTPETVSYSSGKKVWWQCAFGHEWQTTVNNRTTREPGCPVCTKYKLRPSSTDLLTSNPEIAAEWHPTRNGDLTPQTVSSGSGKKVWWQCKLGHEWQATVNNRSAKLSDCPFCSGKKVQPGFNDLKTKCPEVAAEWHPSLNEELTPEMVTLGSTRKVWWQCEQGHEWKTAVYARAGARKTGCPVCARQNALKKR